MRFVFHILIEILVFVEGKVEILIDPKCKTLSLLVIHWYLSYQKIFLMKV
jgi:hypothetical protein